MYWQRAGWRHTLRINSLYGGADVAWRDSDYDVAFFKCENCEIVGHPLLLQDGKSVSNWWFHKLTPDEAYVPYSRLAAAIGALATAPWLSWRFGLRTLLIATTLVAVVLGLIVRMNDR
jgi:hypothetical protein